jgi:hypothetical protein
MAEKFLPYDPAAKALMNTPDLGTDLDFDRVADTRYAKIVASGETISWSELRQYIEDRLAGRPAPRPVAKRRT